MVPSDFSVTTKLSAVSDWRLITDIAVMFIDFDNWPVFLLQVQKR